MKTKKLNLIPDNLYGTLLRHGLTANKSKIPLDYLYEPEKNRSNIKKGYSGCRQDNESLRSFFQRARKRYRTYINDFNTKYLLSKRTVFRPRWPPQEWAKYKNLNMGDHFSSSYIPGNLLYYNGVEQRHSIYIHIDSPRHLAVNQKNILRIVNYLNEEYEIRAKGLKRFKRHGGTGWLPPRITTGTLSIQIPKGTSIHSGHAVAFEICGNGKGGEQVNLCTWGLCGSNESFKMLQQKKYILRSIQILILERAFWPRKRSGG